MAFASETMASSFQYENNSINLKFEMRKRDENENQMATHKTMAHIKNDERKKRRSDFD